MEISLTSGLGGSFAGTVLTISLTFTTSTTLGSNSISAVTPTSSNVRAGASGMADVDARGNDTCEGVADRGGLEEMRDALMLSSSLSEKSLSDTVIIEWKSSSSDSVGVVSRILCLASS